MGAGMGPARRRSERRVLQWHAVRAARAQAVATADTSVAPPAAAFLPPPAVADSGRWKAVSISRKLPVQATSQPTKVVVARLRLERGWMGWQGAELECWGPG